MVKKRIAIDGPAGAGKSTVARMVAERLNYLYIDTGAMYRVITYKALSLDIPLTNEDKLTSLANKTEVVFDYRDGKQRVFCDGTDVTANIRTPLVSRNVSLVAMVPGVRCRMVELQRKMAEQGGVVMDGRDICTQVLPDAECKFFLTASEDERARRRFLELENKGYKTTFEQVKKDLICRDRLDENREVAPLVQASDAILIDSTGMSIEQVVRRILRFCGGK